MRAPVIAATTWAAVHALLWPGYRLERVELAGMLRLPGQITRDFAVVSALMPAVVAHRQQPAGTLRWQPCRTTPEHATARGR